MNNGKFFLAMLLCGVFLIPVSAVRAGESNPSYGLDEPYGLHLMGEVDGWDENFKTPDWVKNAVVYHIFPDRFRDGDPTNNPMNHDITWELWNGRAHFSNWDEPMGSTWYGGDLLGVAEKANYLENLGVTAIYFNPIHDSTDYHAYTVIDYKSVNRYFGSNERDEENNLVLDYEGSLEVFENMMAELDERGVRVILDGVFNHASAKHPWFDIDNEWDWHPYDSELAEYPGAFQSQNSPWYSWFNFTNWPEEYQGWWGIRQMPEIIDNPFHRDYIFGGEGSVLEFWDELGVDGWRLDTPQRLFNTGFWVDFRNHYREINSEGYIVGEEWGDASKWLQGDRWDGTMNYRFKYAVLEWLGGGSPSSLDWQLRDIMSDYPPEAFYASLNLFDSHDTSRVLYELGFTESEEQRQNATERLKLGVILQMTYPGVPVIYYGDEIGMTGASDPYCRNPYPWSDTGREILEVSSGRVISFEPDYDLFGHYQELIGIRMRYPVLRTGSIRTLVADDAKHIYALERQLENQIAVLIYNNGSSAQEVTVDLGDLAPAGTVFVDVLNENAEYTVGSGITLIVSGMWASILINKSSLVTTTLIVDTTPVKGEVFVGGTSWGTASQTRILDPDTYTVSFGPISGYTTPSPQTVALAAGETRTITGIYSAVQPGAGNIILRGIPESVLTSKVTIRGEVTDAQDNPLPNATVKILVNAREAGETTSGSDGYFSIQVTLDEGANEIVVEAYAQGNLLGSSSQTTNYSAEPTEGADLLPISAAVAVVVGVGIGAYLLARRRT